MNWCWRFGIFIQKGSKVIEGAERASNYGMSANVPRKAKVDGPATDAARLRLEFLNEDSFIA